MIIEKTFIIIFGASILIILAGVVLFIWAIIVFITETFGPKDSEQVQNVEDVQIRED